MAIEATPDNVAHLLRRAAWGGRPEEIAAGVEAGIDAVVEQLLDTSAAPPAGDVPRQPHTGFPYTFPEFQAWWLELMATSPTPGLERLSWFWHGHFATSIDKVEWPDLLRDQLVTQRRYALGRVDDLLLAMTHDTAMNFWLDLHLSEVGNINENYARELLELFSMGVDNGYAQRDVEEAARALTGYTVDFVGDGRPMGTAINPGLHDFTNKTFLGETGNWNAEDIVRIIAGRRECHEFIPTRIWHRYAGTPIPDAVRRRAADALASSLSIRDCLRVILTADEFYGDDVKNGLVAQPIETFVRTIRNFGLAVPDYRVTNLVRFETEEDEEIEPNGEDAERIDALFTFIDIAQVFGQVVAQPPNVGGWGHNEAWLDTNSAAGRLRAGFILGEYVAAADSELGERLRTLASRPSELASALLRQFGVVRWTRTTEQAIAAAASSPEPREAVANAVAAAISSPEVTLT